MFVFHLDGITAAGNFYCALLFFLIIVLFWKRCTASADLARNAKGGGFLAIIITFFAVTACYTGDFFGYRLLVDGFTFGTEGFHLEKVYEYIIKFVNNNYALFRLFVWGGAVLCFTLTVKNLKVNPTVALFVMFLLFTTPFCYARATLAMAVYFLGLSMVIRGREQQKKRNVVLGVVVLLCSYLFHKSFAAMIILTLFYNIPITKKTIIPLIVLLAFLGFGIDIFSHSFQDILMGLGDSQLTEKIEQNMEFGEERQGINATLFGWITIIWSYIPFYLTFIMVSIDVLKKERNIEHVSGLFRVTFAIVLVSTAMLLFSKQSLTYFYRYLYMSFIPLSILTAYLFTNGYMTHKNYKTIIYVCGGYNIWYFLNHFINIF